MPSPYDMFVGDVAESMVAAPARGATRDAGSGAKADSGTGGTGSPDAGTGITIDSPVFRPPVPPRLQFAPDKKFQTLLTNRLLAEQTRQGGKAVNLLAYAVADVSGAGVLASNNERSVRPAFSLAKIGVMLALYQLRHDLAQVAGGTKGALSLAPTGTIMRQFLDALKGAPVPVIQQIAADPPKLGDLLIVGQTGEVKILVWPDLWQMIVHSSGTAAFALIDGLGMPWINAVLEQWGIAGLSDPMGGGIRICHSYNDSLYMEHHKTKLVDFPPKRGDVTGVNVASPLGVVHFLVELASKNLVDKESSEQMMQEYLGKAEPSNFGDFLAEKYKADPKVRILRKVGYVGSRACDCAFIEHDIQGKQIRYAAAAFGAQDNPTDGSCDSAVLTKFIEIVDAAVLERNGIKAAPTPSK